jgi:glycosyltransferase involved in cell wall biosynthesis
MIALDISRLLSRAERTTPTGIDRVELAYAGHFLRGNRAVCFAARTVGSRFGLLPREVVEQFLAELSAIWRGGAGASNGTQGTVALAGRLRRAALFGGERALQTRLCGDRDRPLYLTVSHLGLDHPDPIARLKRKCGARVICLIHDLIPIEFPDYTRPLQSRRHQRRIDTVAALADRVIVNSAATEVALRRRIQESFRQPMVVAPLGIDPPIDVPAPESATPAYFVCLGTIEPRKNHALLFDLWQRLAGDLGADAPRLVLIGQRGWRGDQIMEALTRVPRLQCLVGERGDMADVEVAGLLRGARALLLPSFAEGFGLPVAEALGGGVPVLCSDLPALRETGGTAAEYFDPTDADAWYRAVLDYTANSPRRESQLARLTTWRKPLWQDHFAVVDQLLHELM